MVLFGKEFDADERAEVGGGDGGVVETKDRDVATNLRVVVLMIRKQSRKDVFPVRGKEGRYFVFNHRIRRPTRGES
jgi:hypothetical protein